MERFLSKILSKICQKYFMFFFPNLHLPPLIYIFESTNLTSLLSHSESTAVHLGPFLVKFLISFHRYDGESCCLSYFLTYLYIFLN
ncbi:hypothetical protein KFK09_028475 [Dendrobium nobile]|uniref:Uncharacterized protein n=1 Tax=Dendrobium nobile TaxID=94219 RepID=A0A8T3A2Q9_DENNO|nr:hypothetical protein KFK09_028475 [Dendrobium nobile]